MTAKGDTDMTSEATLVKLHTLKAKISAILSEDAEARRIYKTLPYLDELMALLDSSESPTGKELETAAGYYVFLGGCFERLPFYPHAVRCFSKAQSKLFRAIGELGHSKDELCDRLSDLFFRTVKLRNCIAFDTDRPEGDPCQDLMPIMRNYLGEELCVTVFNKGVCAAKESARLCRASHTQQYYNALYEVESEADLRISQLDPALVSPVSLNNTRCKLFKNKGIDWEPPTNR